MTIAQDAQHLKQNEKQEYTILHQDLNKTGFLLPLAILLLFLSYSLPLAAEPVKPEPRDRCPICGMFVAPYPHWLAQIEFSDGSREFFDGPKDMFHFYLSLPEDSSARSKTNINGIYVTEYYSTKMRQAEKLFFVTGSDVYGPMGKELIPIHTREAAETFKRDHKGQALLTFDQVTSDMLPGNK
ncbi:MAG: nitrous oxide reductase accessory protein NosL [Proteobacteria bacterium]|nr:nitrous oxide reductase accessory protein NosL [Pseudomonadota bacterium]MBU1057480.1 nitrous oxide reductase accessory protein NosL [Pseudomonadota bacterium]